MSKAYLAEGEDLLTYNALDVVGTARVRREIHREPDWGSPRVQRLRDVHTQLSKLGAELHTTGFMVHEANRALLIKKLQSLSRTRHKELLKGIGGKRGSPAFRGTDNDMRALLYRRHAVDGILCYDIPEPDEWDAVMWTNDQFTTLAVDKEALLRVFVNPGTPEEVRDAIQLFWRAKAPNKALTTWVTPTNSKGQPSEVQQHIGPDGRMRADWNSAGTETMRWASMLMTLPESKDDESLSGKLPNIRTMYCAAPRHILYHKDWSQQELRMQEAINGDKALASALATGDVYTADAHAWFPGQLERLFGPKWRTVSLKAEWPSGRRQCKVGHLAFQYMAGAPAGWTQALMQDRTIKFSTMVTIRALFHKVYWQTVQYSEEEHEKVMQSGYSEGRILHGRRYYPPTVDDKVHATINETCNYPVQRSAGEMGALAMLGIWDDLRKYKVKARFLTNEHDAFTWECRDDAATRRDIEDISAARMQGPWTIDGNKGTVSRTFPAKGKFGETWADACKD